MHLLLVLFAVIPFFKLLAAYSALGARATPLFGGCGVVEMSILQKLFD